VGGREARIGEIGAPPWAADQACDRARTLREVIYRLIAAASTGGTPDAGDLMAFNLALTEAMQRLQVIPATGGFGWDWDRSDRALDRMLLPVIRSAADLLVSPELNRVRERGLYACTWLFIDQESKPQPALVRHAGLRQRGEVTPALPPQAQRPAMYEGVGMRTPRARTADEAPSSRPSETSMPPASRRGHWTD
jgi:hypothetical protein